jgi:2-aminoethylphosphonate-pyruvate transaminase
VLVNGAYPVLAGGSTGRPAVVERTLDADRGITHVPLVHCETTTGLLNPLAETVVIVARSGRVSKLDAMSSFGALWIDLRRIPITALMASSNKCLEGVPRMGFAPVEPAALAGSRGKSPSLSLDLYDQWCDFEANVAALVSALRQLETEGGPAARLLR